MGLLTTLLERRTSLENPRASLANPPDWLFEALGATGTDAGLSVTPKSALRSAAFACGHVLAQSVAQIPYDVYQRTDSGRSTADGRIEHYLLHSEPNPEMTSFSFRYAAVMRMCFHGNFYAEIERDGAGRTKYIWPLINVSQVSSLRSNRRLIGYEIAELDGEKRRLPVQDVIHIPCIPLDGTEGESILTQARNKIALEQAAEKFGAKLFASGSRPSGILESESALTVEQRRKLEEQWAGLQAGVEKAMKTPVLPAGLKWKQITINPDDAQFLETRNFQVSDVARMFRVPGILVGVTDKAATYASVEQFLLSFTKFTLSPWLQQIEQEINRKLFPGTTRFYSKLDLRGLERGDLQARSMFYKTMTEVGAFTPNTILELEDMNGFDGGDMHLQPLNMGEFGKEPEPAQPSDPVPASRYFLPLFEDAVTLSRNGKKRDAAWVRARFKPVVASVAASAGRVMEESRVDEYLDGLAFRSADWGEHSAKDELAKMLEFISGGMPCN